MARRPRGPGLAPAAPDAAAAGAGGRGARLFAAYARIRVDAQEESVGILAGRLGTDGLRDPRPAVVADAAAGVLTAALRLWARGAGDDARGAADLAAPVERAYDALTGEAADAAAQRTAAQ